MQLCAPLGAIDCHQCGRQTSLLQQRVHQRREALQTRQSCAASEDIISQLSLPRPWCMVGGDVGDFPGNERRPHAFHFRRRSKRGVALAETFQANHVVLGHAQILDARFSGRLRSQSTKRFRKLETARDRRVRDVNVGACLERHFEYNAIRKCFGERGRVRQCMIGSVRPAARASAVRASTNSCSSL